MAQSGLSSSAMDKYFQSKEFRDRLVKEHL
jgi:hypothetical protein